jgi:hypothetical protein
LPNCETGLVPVLPKRAIKTRPDRTLKHHLPVANCVKPGQLYKQKGPKYLTRKVVEFSKIESSLGKLHKVWFSFVLVYLLLIDLTTFLVRYLGTFHL